MAEIDIQENINLAKMTTLGIGGNARFFVEANDESQIIESLLFSDVQQIPVLILGGGSNLLISDAGFSGLVIKNELKGVNYADSDNSSVIVTAASGKNWDDLVAECVSKDLAGVECLSGIPGTVGGTPIQNVGAYGQDVSESIINVRCIDRHSREIVNFSNYECGFSYRTSRFNSTDIDRYVVTEVQFRLRPHGQPKLAYQELTNEFEGVSAPTLKDVRDAILRVRRKKSMVIDQADPNSKSAGSFFKNPIVSCGKLEEMLCELPDIPTFPVDDSHVKLPAAWLIERAGFHKGMRIGRVGLSAKHTLAIVNYDNASAEDVMILKNTIQKGVKNKFGIDLSTEPIFIGFS